MELTYYQGEILIFKPSRAMSLTVINLGVFCSERFEIDSIFLESFCFFLNGRG